MKLKESTDRLLLFSPPLGVERRRLIKLNTVPLLYTGCISGALRNFRNFRARMRKIIINFSFFINVSNIVARFSTLNFFVTRVCYLFFILFIYIVYYIKEIISFGERRKMERRGTGKSYFHLYVGW